VTFTGAVPIACGLQLDFPTVGGARGTAKFRFSQDNGSTWSAEIFTAASVDLTSFGVPLTLAFAAGTYTIGNVYKLKINQWLDQTGNGHHWVSTDGARAKYPVPKVTPEGTALGFDGVDDILHTTTSLANDLVGGTDNAFCVFGLCKIDSVSPSSGTGVILFLGNNGSNARLNWTFLSAGPAHRVIKQDDAAASDTDTGGTPDTTLHVFELVHTGTNVTVLIDGVAVIGPTANDVGALTANLASIGKSMIGAAEGNPTAISWYELLTYSSDLDSTIRSDIRARLMAKYGL
jgi:hypothetical protein